MSEQTQTPLNEYTDVIRNLTELASSISRIEDAKAEASSLKRHGLLDGYIKEEQACILKLRGFEQHRIKLSKELGWDSLTFQQILEKATPAQREVLEPLFQDLRRELQHLVTARDASEQIIKVRLHEIQAAIAKSQGASYNQAGNVNLDSPVYSKLKDRYV